MKLTARKLKQLIKEELEESYMKDKERRYLGTPPMPEDEMMRTDPDRIPNNYATDVDPMEPEQAEMNRKESEAASIAAATETFRKMFPNLDITITSKRK